MIIHLGNKMGQSGKISLGPAVTPENWMRDLDILRDRTAVLGQLLDHDHVTAVT